MTIPPPRLAAALFGPLALVLFGGPAAAQPEPHFVDRAAAAGIEVVTYSGGADKDHLLESTGNGVLVVDYDGDGDPDLFFVGAYRLPPPADAGARDRGAFYRNDGGGRFVDVTDAAGLGARFYGHGGAVGDVDGDGLPDLHVTAFGPDLLFRNNGDGTFTESAARLGLDEPGWSIGSTFFDADGDGDHDLYVARYVEATWEEVLAARRTRRWRGRVDVMDGPRGLPGSGNRFYRNEGGTFREATAEAGFDGCGRGYSMGVASLDFDADGDVDLFVANDSTPNCLYRNDGGGRFEEIGVEAGCAYDAAGEAQGSMGVGVGDYDGDGWLDLAVTNFANDYYTLYRNLDGELFVDDSFDAGLAVPTFVPLGWAALFFDADQDRDLDLFFANGHIYPQVDSDPDLHESFEQPDQLFWNEGGRFVEAEPRGALGTRESSRGAALLDFDGDGDLDLAVSHQDARPRLLENRGGGGRWLSAEPRGPSGAPALGARVAVTAGGVTQVRELASGGGYASQSELRLHVGLGDAAVDRLLVTWPDGARRALERPPAGRRYAIPRAPGRP